MGLLIAKYRSIGGMPYDVFTKLFETLVWPVISYGASIWGFKSYTCINAVQNRALRFYLGTGKYTPTAAVAGDMGWQPAFVKQWNHWRRHLTMNSKRLNKRIFIWSYRKSNRWFYNVRNSFKKFGLADRYVDISNSMPKSKFITDVTEAVMNVYIQDWKKTVNRHESIRGNGHNKLRIYKKFKYEFGIENYCKIILPLQHRSAFAKFRSGVAPIRIETGRYENINVNERLCPLCHTSIEDEMHVILYCNIYDDIRITLIERACAISDEFSNFDDISKLCFLFSHPDLIRLCAKTCFKILQRRNCILHA